MQETIQNADPNNGFNTSVNPDKRYDIESVIDKFNGLKNKAYPELARYLDVLDVNDIFKGDMSLSQRKYVVTLINDLKLHVSIETPKLANAPNGRVDFFASVIKELTQVLDMTESQFEKYMTDKNVM